MSPEKYKVHTKALLSFTNILSEMKNEFITFDFVFDRQAFETYARNEWRYIVLQTSIVIKTIDRLINDSQVATYTDIFCFKQRPNNLKRISSP